MRKSSAIAVGLSLFCGPLCAYAEPGTNEVKAMIISIQHAVVDLTDPIEPLYCKQFVDSRNSMTEQTAMQIVKLIRDSDLTSTQAEIAVLLLSGLPQQEYWSVTEQLLDDQHGQGSAQ